MTALRISIFGLIATLMAGFALPTAPARLPPAPPPGPEFTLITEPNDGMAPVLSAIESAKTSVDLVIYEMTDTEVVRALADAKARGVAVRVLLDKGYYGAADHLNDDAYARLHAAGVPVHWTPASFALTHQKTLVTDGNDALVMTFNLAPRYYASSRDFAVDDRDPADVAAIEAVFNDDWYGRGSKEPAGDDLVWSPGSRDALLGLINGARSSLRIYNEEMNDPKVTAALEAASAGGVRVEVVMTYATSWKKAFGELRAHGIDVRTYASTAARYIHAKMILADGTAAFLGSENFSPTSLDANRELGLIIRDPAILKTLAATFDADRSAARPY